jgi:DNA polymerase-4
MAPWDRIIVHADMDAFFAAIEQLDRPELRGRPILVARDGPRSVVTTASYEARPFGVGSAMPLAEAKRRCPEALVVEPRFDRYKEASRQVMGALRSFSPILEALSLDEAFLDMSERARAHRTPRQMGQAIQEAVREATGGLGVSVGIATSKFVAKVASDFRKPAGLTVVSGSRVEAFLHPLPLGKLWGVGPKTEARLRELGLRTIGDVAKASPSLLRAGVGRSAASLQQLASGVDPREVRPHRPTKSLSAEETLERDVVGAHAMRPYLHHAADTVAARLRRAGLHARGVRVKLRTADFRIHTRQTTLPTATDEARTIFASALSLLPAFELEAPVRLVGVGTFELKAKDGPSQIELFPQGEVGPAAPRAQTPGAAAARHVGEHR